MPVSRAMALGYRIVARRAAVRAAAAGPAAAVRCARRRQVDLAAQPVDALHLDCDGVAEAVAAPGRFADERRLVLAHFEAFPAQAARGEETLEDLAEADEQAASNEADDLAGELLLPALVLEALVEQKTESDGVGVLLQADELALPRGAVFGGGGELRFAQLAAALAEVIQQAAVGHEVRVAADRRREVQVRRAREPEVPEVGRAVARLLERAQQKRRPGLPAPTFARARLGDDAAQAAERLRELL